MKDSLTHTAKTAKRTRLTFGTYYDIIGALALLIHFQKSEGLPEIEKLENSHKCRSRYKTKRKTHLPSEVKENNVENQGCFP